MAELIANIKQETLDASLNSAHCDQRVYTTKAVTVAATDTNYTPDVHDVLQDNLAMLESVLNVVGNSEHVPDEDIIGTSDEESDMDDSTFDSNNNEIEHIDIKFNVFPTASIQPYSVTEQVGNVVTVTKGPKHECPDCFRTFTRKDTLNLHIKRQTCKKTLNKNLSSKQNHSKVKLYECNICLNVFTTRNGHIQHMETHKGIRYECESCGQSFSRQKTLDIHLKLHRTDKTGRFKSFLRCDICKKMFATEKSLALHKQVHTGTQKYTCSTCDARFSRKSDLERHELIHTGEKPYKCGLCQKSFRSPGDLGRHRKWHSGALTCKYCGKIYARKNELYLHEAKHVTNGDAQDNDTFENKSKSHVCEVCSAGLATELNLRNHMLIHERHNTAKRRFGCGLCEETFSTSGNRSRHIKRYHTESESILKCDICSKAFVIVGELRKHIRTVHQQQWAFPCAFLRKDLTERESMFST